jgi:4-hydroxy-tetrahydrodipicolinate synthase
VLLELAAHPRIAAVKDCSGDAEAATDLLRDGRLQLLAGNDDELFAQLALGAAGGITASAHLRADLFVRLHHLLASERLDEARRLWRDLRPLVAALFSEPNPMPLKAVLARLGRLGPALRAPLHPAPDETVTRVMDVLRALEQRHPRCTSPATC